MLSKLKAVFAWFAGLFAGEVARRVRAALDATAPYVEKALEVCEQIAELTPNRTDDELVAAMKKFDVAVFKLGSSAEERAETLRRLALTVLQRRFPMVPASDLNRAIEIAVGALRWVTAE